MSDRRPILSITIPTYSRSPYLAELLECLLPQLTEERRVELIVSDNASIDDTELMIAGYIARGLPCEYVRNPTNLGADGNFLRCLDLATGKYVWVLGDDDLVASNAISLLMAMIDATAEDFDLIYLSSFGFSGNDRPSPRQDPLGRFAEIVTDGDYLLEKVNALIGLISVNIVNKDRLLSSTYPPISDLHDSNLIQVGWLFPLIHRHCRVLYVIERLVFYRQYNSGGWGICEVFGIRLHGIASRYFAAEPTLAASLMNGVLRYWLPDVIVEKRRGQQQSMNSEDFAQTLQPLFKSNWRYWVFVYLVAVPPMAFALPMHYLNRKVNRISRAIQVLYRHWFYRPEPVRPGPPARNKRQIAVS